MNYIIRKTYTE